MNVSVFGRREGTHRRLGACHQCGWTQNLRKVTGEEAVVIRNSSVTGPRSGLRWLCGDCITDLTTVHGDEPVPTHAGSLSLAAAYARHRAQARSRSVA